MALQITNAVRRRFILGKQGLWPGRRWRGKKGLEAALNVLQGVQMDPVSIVAQSHDIVLWGRVLDYQHDLLDTLMYQERKFFDYGGALFIYPMTELPYWRLAMARMADVDRWTTFAQENRDAIAFVRQEIEGRGPLRKRDFGGELIEHYRGSKVSGVSLYYLWLIGELMTHHRMGKERVYDFRENIAPDHLDHPMETAEAESFFALKTIHIQGLTTDRTLRNGWKGFLVRNVARNEAQAKITELLDSQAIEEIEIEGQKELHYALSADIPILERLVSGKLPSSWFPLEKTTSEEVIFLSPLEYVSARGRAGKLFDFDYIWEIYKPAGKRQYGPYTLPILYGDRLVGRMDAKFDRQVDELVINGLWLEEWFHPDKHFISALGHGLTRFVGFLGANGVQYEAVQPADFYGLLTQALE